jgi:hypothetical protein
MKVKKAEVRDSKRYVNPRKKSISGGDQSGYLSAMEEKAVTPKDIFAEEIATYNHHKGGLIKSHAGKFLLIHKKELGGVFDSEANALKEGYHRFGPVPLYIRQLLPEEGVQSIPALTLGLLSIA